MKATCDEVAHAGGSGNYVSLEGCIEMERNAAEQNKSRQFKY
jgi:hypothetical protein